MMTEQPPSTTAARFRAELLVASVEDALRSGVRHYDDRGKPLLTMESVLEELVLNRCVTLQDPMPGQEALPR